MKYLSNRFYHLSGVKVAEQFSAWHSSARISPLVGPEFYPGSQLHFVFRVWLAGKDVKVVSDTPRNKRSANQKSKPDGEVVHVSVFPPVILVP